MTRVTFDSNVWRMAADPGCCPEDPEQGAFEHIHRAIAAGSIEPLLSVTMFTIEGVRRTDRPTVVGRYRPSITATGAPGAGGGFRLRLGIEPNQAAHPGINEQLGAHLTVAIAAGFRLLRCPRIGGFDTSDLDREWFVQPGDVPLSDILDRFAQVAQKIEDAGAGIAILQQLGSSHASPGDPWQRGLRNVPETEGRRLSRALAEWADGDTVAAHVAYCGDFLCTRDMARGAGVTSVFASANRAWLTAEYGVRFVTPGELASHV